MLKHDKGHKRGRKKGQKSKTGFKTVDGGENRFGYVYPHPLEPWMRELQLGDWCKLKPNGMIKIPWAQGALIKVKGIFQWGIAGVSVLTKHEAVFPIKAYWDEIEAYQAPGLVGLRVKRL